MGWIERSTNKHRSHATTLDTAAGEWFAWRNDDGWAVIGKKPYCARTAVIGRYQSRTEAIEAAQAANAKRSSWGFGAEASAAEQDNDGTDQNFR